MSAEIQSVRIFIAYSSKDLEFQKELKNHLEPLVRNKRIVVMDNYAINPGDNWDEKIGQMLEQSDIVLLLLSADALASPHFFREAGIAIERRRQGRTDIIPVKLRPCDLEDEPLLHELDLLEVLPEKDVPVVKWPHRDEAYVSIVQGLKKVLRGREEAVIAREQRTQQEAAEAADTAAWQSAERANNEAAYKRYLQQYPGGLHAVQAKKKIAAYEQTREESAQKKREKEAAETRAREEVEKRRREESERKRREAEQANREQQLLEQADHDLWEFAEEADTEAAYKKYLSKYPRGFHAAAAHIFAKRREEDERKKREEAEKRRKQEEVERLKKEEEQADKSAWELAQKTDTAEGYARYLSMYSSGRYAVQAYRLQQELIENEATAKKQREEEARKKRERETAEARAHEEADRKKREEEEKRREQEVLATMEREQKRKQQEADEAKRQRQIDLEKERQKVKVQVEALLLEGKKEMQKEADHSKAKAIELYSQIITLDPNNINAYHSRGAALFILNRYEEALKDYNRVIQIGPHPEDIFEARGEIYMKLGRYKEAAQDFERWKETTSKQAVAVLKHRKALRFLEASDNPQPPEDKKKNWLGF